MARTRQIHSLVPKDLYMAAKAELRGQGRTVREWLVEQMTWLVKDGPAFRAFLREHSQRPEAKQRGLLPKN
jgi:hypothetical protein